MDGQLRVVCYRLSHFRLMELIEAIQEGDIEAVKQAIADGADVNAKDDKGRTPLDRAITLLQFEIADLIRKHGGKSGAEDSIHVAAEMVNIEAVKQHIAAGADVNAKSDNGWTPLLYAALNEFPPLGGPYSGRNETVKLLIAAGADVNAKIDNGGTPLHGAALKGHKEVAELLIAKGADVNAKTDDGWTPLLYATREGSKEIAELLISKGADVNEKDDDGRTPLDWAEEEKSKKIADLLRKHGAKTGEELK